MSKQNSAAKDTDRYVHQPPEPTGPRQRDQIRSVAKETLDVPQEANRTPRSRAPGTAPPDLARQADEDAGGPFTTHH
jgi:hypothetical protein